MLAIFYATERFRIYFLGVPFVMRTDCHAIKLALSKKEINPRINRWALHLQNFQYKVEHRASERMKHVDALSREIFVIEPLSFEQELMFKQLADPELKEISDSLKYGESEKYANRNGLLYRKYNDSSLLCVPASTISNVTIFCHDEVGHVGVDKTVELITRTYWFRELRKKVKEHVGNCLKCLVYNVRSEKAEGELHIWIRAKKPFEAVFVNHYGPLNVVTFGYKHIFLIIDGYIKFVVLYPFKSTSSKETIGKIKNYIHHYGKPRTLVSDRGTCFTSE